MALLSWQQDRVLEVRIQGLLEHKVRHAVGAYNQPVPVRLKPPYARCKTLCSIDPCRAIGVGGVIIKS